MTGAKYGIYDLEWIINALAIDEEHDRIYVAARGLYAVEEYLQARYYMFRQVYFHRTLRSAEAVLRSILRRALQLLEAGESVWYAPDTAFEKVLRRKSLSLAEHLEMDDSDVIFHVKQWQRSADPILSDLSRRFVGRRLFKAIDLDMPVSERADFLSMARETASRAPVSIRITTSSKTAPAMFPTTTTTPPRAPSRRRASTWKTATRVRRFARSAKSAKSCAGCNEAMSCIESVFHQTSKKRFTPFITELRQGRNRVPARKPPAGIKAWLISEAIKK